MNKKLAITIVAWVIVVGGVIMGGIFILWLPSQQPARAYIRIGQYHEEVVETITILNPTPVFEGTDLSLQFDHLNESKYYGLWLIIGGRLKQYGLGIADNSCKIPFSLNTSFTGLHLYAYEYELNTTSLELYSITVYPLIWVSIIWGD